MNTALAKAQGLKSLGCFLRPGLTVQMKHPIQRADYDSNTDRICILPAGAPASQAVRVAPQQSRCLVLMPGTSSTSRNMVIETLSLARSHGGMQGVDGYESLETKTGVASTENGEFGGACAELGMILSRRTPVLGEGECPAIRKRARADASISLHLRYQPGYDHSYYFVSTFMEEHLRWHADRCDHEIA
jgi:S-formylglutathione hydrolase FrmB